MRSATTPPPPGSWPSGGWRGWGSGRGSPSAVRRAPHLPAHVEHRAGRAAREGAGADVLAEGDQEAVDLHPVAAGELLLQGEHRLLRRRLPHVAPYLCALFAA